MLRAGAQNNGGFNVLSSAEVSVGFAHRARSFSCECESKKPTQPCSLPEAWKWYCLPSLHYEQNQCSVFYSTVSIPNV